LSLIKLKFGAYFILGTLGDCINCI